MSGLALGAGQSPHRALQLAHWYRAFELRIVQLDADPQRPKPLNALELVELQVLDVRTQIAQVLQVLDVVAVLGGFLGLRVVFDLLILCASNR